MFLHVAAIFVTFATKFYATICIIFTRKNAFIFDSYIFIDKTIYIIIIINIIVYIDNNILLLHIFNNIFLLHICSNM